MLKFSKKVIFIILTAVLYIYSFGLSFSKQEVIEWLTPVNCYELNSSGDEFAPMWNNYESVLYFNSNRSSYSKYYIAKLSDTLNFYAPVELKGYLNKKGNNQSYITFLTEDEAYISTFNMYERGPKLNLFRTFKKKQVWSEPIIIEGLQDNSFNSHPTVSPDGRILIFSSDRNSEHGDTDLWMSYLLDDGTWGAPVSLDEINSPGNEITPFLLSADTLYFSTNGQEGKGGYDIYMSIRFQGMWQRPLPIDVINTEFDESDFSILPDNRAIFSSNRPGGLGGLDLYISRFIPVKVEIAESQSLNLELKSLVSSLSIKNYLNYHYLPIIPYIFINVDNNESSNKVSLEYNEEFNYKLKSISELYNLSPSLISERFKRFKNKFLNILFSSNDNMSNDDSIEYSALKKFDGKNFLISNSRDVYYYFNTLSGIERNRINLINLELKNQTKSDEYAIISCDDANIFEPIKAGTDSVLLEPSVLDVFFEIKPVEYIKKWNCKLIISGSEFNIIESDIFHDKISIDLNLYKNQIWRADSLVVKLSVIDNDSNEFTRTLSLLVIHNKIEQELPIFINGKKIKQYLFFLADINHLKYTTAFTPMLEFIKEKISNSKKITVCYFNKTNNIPKENAKGLIEELKMKKPNSQFVLEYKLNPYLIELDEEFSKYLIAVLIEE